MNRREWRIGGALCVGALIGVPLALQSQQRSEPVSAAVEKIEWFTALEPALKAATEIGEASHDRLFRHLMHAVQDA